MSTPPIDAALPTVGVFGAGAIGLWLAARARLAGSRVTVFARGRAERELGERGVLLCHAGSGTCVPVEVGGTGGTPPDFLLLCTKAHDLPAALDGIERIAAPGTVLVTVCNGLPWWFGAGRFRLRSVDPDGMLSRRLAGFETLGAVVHASASSPSPGVVRLVAEDRLTFGGAAGPSASAEALAAVFRRAPLATAVSDDIRAEIWLKLWGNITMNPLSALTGSTTGALLSEPSVRTLCISMMEEMQAIGGRIGIDVPLTAAERIAVTERLGDFRTSMLQDAERGRPLELAPLMTAVLEIASQVEVPAPHIELVHALVRLRQAATAPGSRATS